MQVLRKEAKTRRTRTSLYKSRVGKASLRKILKPGSPSPLAEDTPLKLRGPVIIHTEDSYTSE